MWRGWGKEERRSIKKEPVVLEGSNTAFFNGNWCFKKRNVVSCGRSH